VGRGLYLKPDSDLTEHHALVEAASQVPKGIICLLSALSFHGLTTQSPFQVWMALDGKARKPKVSYPPLRIMRFSAQSLAYGVEDHFVEGRLVCITSPAKTVADCFKYRHKVGTDVAVEALRDFLRKANCLDPLFEACRVCRVSRVIRPYVEALA
jgi:predicted transcriptional regulator of viral defense system